MSALAAVFSTRVERCRKFLEGFLYGVYRSWNDFDSIPTVKMETKNPVAGYFGSEFPAICNHCGVMAAWSDKTL